MKLSTVFLVAGLIFLVVGVVFFVAAPIFLVTVQPAEVWEARSNDIYKELVYRVPGWQNDYWIQPYFPPLIIEDAKDFAVSGKIAELTGHIFNFYVFNASNYEYWKAGLPYKAYIEGKGTTQYSFEFKSSRDDYLSLRFVVENPNPAPIYPEPSDLVFKVSATMRWQEKSLKERLAPLAYAAGLSMLGVLLTLIGIGLAAAGGIIHLLRKTPSAPVEPVTALPVHFCSGCGAEVSGATERFCRRCGRRL